MMSILDDELPHNLRGAEDYVCLSDLTDSLDPITAARLKTFAYHTGHRRVPVIEATLLAELVGGAGA